jgi:microcystin-dependent protein
MLNLIYPVGYVITLGVSTNPATLLGIGTWTAIEGTVIVGKAAAGTFDTLNATGGAETVTLTAAQSGLPAHTHVQTGNDSGAGSGNVNTYVTNQGSTNMANSTAANSAAAASEAHTNLQPYIVKYCWERTA